jgi:tight adherence protein B
MSPILILIVGLIIILILVAAGVLITSNRENPNAIDERLDQYQQGASFSNVVDLQPEEPDKRVITEWVNSRVSQSSFGDRVAKSLAQADMKFKSGEFITMVGIFALFLGGLGFTFTGTTIGPRLLSGLLGIVIGIIVPFQYLNSQKGKRLARFSQQLPDMLNLLVNGLQAGYSTMQALESVSKEMPSPISDEFRRVVQEMQLGIPMERALANLLRRIPSEDLDFIVTAINVQREVGGPLADILDTIAFTIRERIKIKGEIRVMVSQVSMSGKILAFVPFVVFALLWFINQDYMSEFFNNLVCGGAALGTGFVLIMMGYFAMMKIADIEV